MKRALLVIDIQNDFCKGGSLEVKLSEEIVPIANKLIDKFNETGEYIIATKDWHPANHESFAVNSNKKIGEFGELHGLAQVFWPEHCVQNTHGSEFHPNLHPINNVVYKGMDKDIDSYSGFFDNGKRKETGLNKKLKEKHIDTLYIVGLATDYCVKFTALDAAKLGYDVFLVEDGCKGVNINPDDSLNAIEEMKLAGVKTINSSQL